MTVSPPSPEDDARGLLDALLRRRLVVVTGKGGTGKSTLAATLGMAAASRGRRVLLLEIGGARGLARMLGGAAPPYREERVRDGLFLFSMNGEAALEEYLVRQVKARAIYRLVFRNRWMGPFLDMVPGLADIVQLGKIWDLAQELDGERRRWDLIVLDAPATGHGLTLLSSPASMMELTRSGPFHGNAARVHALVSDPEQTAVLLTAMAEPLPVNEALETARRLGASRPLLQACVLGQVQPPPFTPLSAWPVVRPHLAAVDDPAWREAVALTDRWVGEGERQALARARLQRGLGVPVLSLPALPCRDPGPEELEALAGSFWGSPAGDQT